MGSFLPTATIILAEVSAVLLIVAGFLLFRIRRLQRRHLAEIDTLMGIAGNARAIRLQRNTVPPAAAVQANDPEADADVSAPPPTADAAAPSPEPAAPRPAPATAPETDEERQRNHDRLIAHIDQGLTGIRDEVEQLSTRFNQFRHEYHQLANQFHKTVEDGNHEIRYARNDLERVSQAINEIRRQQPAAAPVSPPAAAGRPPLPAGRPPASAPATPADPPTPPDSRTEGINVEEINFGEPDIDDAHELHEGRGRPSRFDEDRIFFQSSLENGLEQGWYFTGFGNRPHGPFADRESAERVMKEMHRQLAHGGKAK